MKKNLKLSKFIIGTSVATGFIGFAGLGLSVTAHAEEVETISIPATTESIQNNSHLVTNTETKPVEKESSVNNTSVTNLDSNKPTTENTTREKPVSEKPDNSNKPADTSNISKPSTTTETPKKDTDVNESPKLSGWVTKDGYKYYYENGKPITGLQKIDAARGSKTKYFALFDSKGRMHVNYWAKNSKGKRYFDKNGKMMTGWYNDGVERRYFHPKTGYMFTGLHRMDSSLYKTKTHYSMFDTNTGYIKKASLNFQKELATSL